MGVYTFQQLACQDLRLTFSLCKVCGQTFATTQGTIFYRLRHAPERVIQVWVLLAYGCPIQAIVKAFGLDERTVRS